MTLKEQNEILKDKVKHLENMIEIMDSIHYGTLRLTKDYNPDFQSYNHKTKRNKDGNLITYYTK